VSDTFAARTGFSNPFRSPHAVIIALSLIAALLIVGFMTIGARGNWDFILMFRGRKLLALIVVGYAVAISTVAFQTVAQNRILTPAIMGFDALFVLLQSLLVFVFGSFAVITFNPKAMFALETLVMSGFALTIYGFLFFGAKRNLHLVMLVGIVLGVLFRSLTDLIVRLIDPNEFATLQDLFYAGFNAVDTDLLGLSIVILAIGSILAWRRFPAWDVLALGRDTSINLGLTHRREVFGVLALVTVFVSVSTALVGPVTFFGLLVANLAYLITPSHKHIHIVPVAALLAVICLIGGQMLLERVFSFNTSLSIIIEFAGGLVFILLLLKGHAR
jgi:iron complex transport system permease protein